MPINSLPGEIRLANAVAALAQARVLLGSAAGSAAGLATGSTSGPTTASIDLAGLTVFDSAALAVLAALRREAAGPLRFANPPANLRKLAALYGVDTLLFGSADGCAAA
ncbi:MAG: STAS domain-containing protein [Burkholderiales bacterium]